MKHGTIRSPSVSSTPIRQTVLSGSIDSAGFPNALAIGSGLSVTLSASVTPLLLSFAGGFDSNGAIDYIGQLTANQTFSGLPASAAFVFLYVDRNLVTGALTVGHTTAGFAHQAIAPTSPAVGFLWFDLSTFTMKQWSGAVWVVVQRVLIGECVTSATNVTAVVTYAYRGLYQSAWLAVVANSLYSFNHNLGVIMAQGCDYQVYSSVTGTDGDAVIAPFALPSGALFYGYQRVNGGLFTWRTVQIRLLDFVLLDAANAWQTSGFYKIIARRLF